MKGKRACIILLLIIIVASLTVTQSPICQAQSKIVNHTLTFHNYSVILKDANNSFIAYNGADGAAPSGTVSQVTLESQITGTRDGWSYYRAVAMWVIPLQSDLHVKGTVNIQAYLSSTFSLTGFLTGGGYGFGVVDVDENNVEVTEFTTEANPTIGSNPFTQDPTQYSLSVNVDYVFRKGHAIGFAVGFGATVRGFEATVYFDSQSRNSGATLPVEETMTSQTFTAQSGGTAYNVQVSSDSTVSGFQYDAGAKRLQFKAQGIPYTSGSCEVLIPKTLMQAPFTVTMGNQKLSVSASEDSVNTRLTFTHLRTTDVIIITSGDPTPTSVVAEYPSTSLFPFVAGFLLFTLLAATVLWRRKPRKR